MKNNLKALKLVEFGLKPSNVAKLTESEVNEIYTKLISEQVKEKKSYDVTGSGTVTTPMPKGATVTKKPDGTISLTPNEGEVGESKKKKRKPNPWAICHAQVGPKKTRKFERCVKSVKKSLEEGKNPLSLFFEEEIMRIVENNLPPRMTKGDLLKYLSEDTKTKPKEKEKEKEKEKPERKNPFKPSPHKQPKPKAHKEETKEAVMDAPAKPKTKPGTKPTTKPGQKPGTPFRPSPHKQPKPKARIPQWLTFDSMGIKLKK